MTDLTLIFDRFVRLEKFIAEAYTVPGWLDLRSASKYAGLSVSTLKRAVAGGKLKVAKGAGKLLFKPAWIDSYLINGNCDRMNPMERLKNAI